MGRATRKAPETPKAAAEDLATVTQTRARRTPKPNPKYANEAVVIAPKIESSESNGSTDIEDKLPESKIVKSTKKVISKNPEDAKSAKSTPAAKGRAAAAAVKKQKIEFDDDEKTKDADEVPISPSPPARTTRSGKAESKDEKGEIKVGDESVAIIDVSSIIAKGPAKQQDSPKAQASPARGATRKRQAAEVVETSKEDSPKKKKEEDKPSLITARKSYMPPTKKEEEASAEDATASEPEVKRETMTPVSTIKTRRNAVTSQQKPAAVAVPAPKLEEAEVKPEPKAVVSATMLKTAAEPKKLPVMKKEAITKVAPLAASLTTTLPTKARVINNVVLSPQKSQIAASVATTPLPAPRVLNSMVSPKGAKLSPNVKLASSEGVDKKVFSIEMSDGSLIEKKPITSPIKVTPSAVKENVAIAPKPQPSMLLKNTLESELNRMKASANLMKRQMIGPQIRQSSAAQNAARRVTKFEKWYVIDVKGPDYVAPIKHLHTHSLIRIGNKIKELQLPSARWDYKVTLQKKQLKKQNNNDGEDEEIYTGEIDSTVEVERHNIEPTSILFKRSYKDSQKNIIDRSLMLKQDSYAITMNGKQCQLVGAPNDIKSLEDLEILLKIVDTSSPNHSCVESC